MGVVSSTGIAGLTLGGGVGWLSAPRTDDRQPGHRRRCSRERRTNNGKRIRKRRPVLGASRWWRELRRRYVIHVPCPPAGAKRLHRHVDLRTAALGRSPWCVCRLVGGPARCALDDHHVHGSTTDVGTRRQRADVPRLRVGRQRSGGRRGGDRPPPGRLRRRRRGPRPNDVARLPVVVRSPGANRGASLLAQRPVRSLRWSDDPGGGRALRSADQVWDRRRSPSHGWRIRSRRGEATAFPNRSAQFWLNIYGFWSAEFPTTQRWSNGSKASPTRWPRTPWQANTSISSGTMTRSPSRTLAAYGPSKLARLQTLKRRHDPGNRFRINLNIPPGATPGQVVARRDLA